MQLLSGTLINVNDRKHWTAHRPNTKTLLAPAVWPTKVNNEANCFNARLHLQEYA
jgi:hypothetical protein